MLNRLTLKYRFIIFAISLSCLFSVSSYLAIYAYSKIHFSSFLISLMKDHQILFEQSIEDVRKLDLPPSDLKAWLDSGVEENGFIKDNISDQKLYSIRRSNNNFTIEIADISLASWINHIQPRLIISLGIGAIVLAMFSFFYLLQSLKPLSELRRATEDILAGRHDMSFSYVYNDEVGMISQALKKLTKDLEKKDTILEKYTELATTDGMTGLKNHRFFKEAFQRELSLCKRHSDTCGLILLDVDHFKKFNDTYGHQQGDEVLKQVAIVLRSTARNTDIVARYGGEEFVLVLPKTDIEGLKTLAEKLRSTLELTQIPYLAKKGDFLSVTASFGVISIDGKKIDNFEYTAFVEAADKNLYEAKRKGRNCAVTAEWKGNA